MTTCEECGNESCITATYGERDLCWKCGTASLLGDALCESAPQFEVVVKDGTITLTERVLH